MRQSFWCAAVLLLIAGGGVQCQPDRVLLSGISVLTFVDGRVTRARRNVSRPQLECTGGSAKDERDLQPSSMRCVNTGFSERGVFWECRPIAPLSEDVELGKMTVSCEGYSYPDDKFVLRDSCWLQYELSFVDGNRPSPSSLGCGHGNDTTTDCGVAKTSLQNNNIYPSLFSTLWEPLIIAVLIAVFFNVRRAVIQLNLWH
eukprot:Plantae.Rhodophyta-Purpureofilum_apyrenoidigerum.ctg57332.p1 GENE.Plantae.Rhodophyta-Purpureofilum_apyrenoidigerum.ctg57332~~Plantae.Rhodophyta-Purpureofilum_apyrenoidigerum.ctg57332.p1  ORF type:complete len:201 (-),score=18.48 Plantae.Rhodophyta-Purpureofilum_apyrenoidigerum.ctg57332:9-611(-)